MLSFQSALTLLLHTVSFDSTLNAWSKTSDPVPEKAEMVLQQMIDLFESTALEKLEPGPRHLTLLLKCCLNQNRQNGGGTDKIEAPLRRFEAIADESNFNYGAFMSF